MPSLLIIIIFGAVLAVTNASSFFYGKHVQSAEDKAEQLTAVNQAVTDANKQAKRDLDQAVIAADKAAKAKTRTITIRGQAVEVIREVPLPATCDWSPAAFGVLLDAVNAASDKPESTGSLPQPLPRAGTAGKPAR